MTSEIKSPQLWEYPLCENVRAFSTTRESGYSKGNYGSFNINAYCGDDVTDTSRNLSLLSQKIGIPVSNIIQLHQVHRDKILVVDDEFMSQTDENKKKSADGFDAVMTNIKGVCIGVSTADCIPIVLYDEGHKSVCVAHAGWRGTVLRVAEKAVSMMHSVYSASPSHIKAVIGPGISLEAFEVGEEVYESFEKAGFPMHKIACRMPAATGGEKWHIDLWAANYLSLEKAGVSDIKVAGICTYNNYDRFFSARRLGVESGRIYTAAFIK